MFNKKYFSLDASDECMNPKKKHRGTKRDMKLAAELLHWTSFTFTANRDLFNVITMYLLTYAHFVYS